MSEKGWRVENDGYIYWLNATLVLLDEKEVHGE